MSVTCGVVQMRMKFWFACVLILSAHLFGAGYALAAEPTRCVVEGPAQLAPESVARVHLGMSLAELETVLGKADYSPADGVFYFSTGDDCPLADSGRTASCGVVAMFRSSGPNATTDKVVVTETLQSCVWGGIGE